MAKRINSLIDYNTEGDGSSAESDLEVLKEIAQDLTSKEKFSMPINEQLSNIINDVWVSPPNKDTLAKKLELYGTPENCKALKVKRCNPEIWGPLITSQKRQKDLRDQNTQACISKSVVAIGSIADELLKNKNNKNMTVKDHREACGKLLKTTTDAIAMLSKSNANLNSLRRYSLVGGLDTTYQQLAKNVPENSELLFGEDLTKRLQVLKTNKQILAKDNTPNPQPYYNKSKNFKRFPQYPGNRQRKGNFYPNQYQNAKPKQQRPYKKIKGMFA